MQANSHLPKVVYLDNATLEEKVDNMIALIDAHRGSKNRGIALARAFSAKVAGMDAAVDRLLDPLRRPRKGNLAAILTHQNKVFRAMRVGELRDAGDELVNVVDRFRRVTSKTYLGKDIVWGKAYKRDPVTADVHADINAALNDYIEAVGISYALTCGHNVQPGQMKQFIHVMCSSIVGNAPVTDISGTSVQKVDFGKRSPI